MQPTADIVEDERAGNALLPQDRFEVGHSCTSLRICAPPRRRAATIVSAREALRAMARRTAQRPSRIWDSVWRAVSASGSSLSSITVGLLLASAWRKAGAKSSVASMV